MSKFLKHAADWFVRPRIALRALLGDPLRVGYGFPGHLTLAVVYFIGVSVALGMDAAHLPEFLVLNIPADQYYSYGKFFILDEAVICKHCCRDLSTRQPKDLSVLKDNLEKIVGKYISYGYKLISRTETAATLERWAPIVATYMIATILLLWPAAILYAIPGLHKQYRIQLHVKPDGSVDELGETIEKFNSDKERSNQNGWILIGVAVFLFISVSSPASHLA